MWANFTIIPKFLKCFLCFFWGGDYGFPDTFPHTTLGWLRTPAVEVQVTPISRQLGHLRGTHTWQLRKSTSHRTTIGDLRVVTTFCKKMGSKPSEESNKKNTGSFLPGDLLTLEGITKWPESFGWFPWSSGARNRKWVNPTWCFNFCTTQKTDIASEKMSFIW